MNIVEALESQILGARYEFDVTRDRLIIMLSKNDYTLLRYETSYDRRYFSDAVLGLTTDTFQGIDIHVAEVDEPMILIKAKYFAKLG